MNKNRNNNSEQQFWTKIVNKKTNKNEWANTCRWTRVDDDHRHKQHNLTKQTTIATTTNTTQSPNNTTNTTKTDKNRQKHTDPARPAVTRGTDACLPRVPAPTHESYARQFLPHCRWNQQERAHNATRDTWVTNVRKQTTEVNNRTEKWMKWRCNSNS